jgi:hypothetical protein
MATDRPDTRPAPLYIRPAPGRLVRHPDSMRPLRDGGERVHGHRFYWHRMIQAGDVLVVSQPAEPEKGET